MAQNKQGHHGKKDGAAKPKRGRGFRIPSGAPRAAGSTGAMPPVGSTPSATGAMAPLRESGPASTGAHAPVAPGPAGAHGPAPSAPATSTVPVSPVRSGSTGAMAPLRPASTGSMPPVPPRGPEQAASFAGGYVPSYQASPVPPEEKRHRGLKIFGITVGIILGVLAVVYLAGVFIFMGRFFPNSSIIDMDISGKTPEEVHQMLDGVLGDYTFKVEGHGLSLTLSAADMGMSLDSQSIADGLLSEMNPWAWPYEVFQSHDDTDDLVSTFEETKLADTIHGAVEEANARGTAPKNAMVAYDAAEHAFVVVPEEEGNTLLADKVMDEVARGTVNFAPKVTLSDAVLARPEVLSSDPALAAARDEANKYVSAPVSVTMEGVERLAIDADAIAAHITIGDDLSVAYDPEPLVAMVKEQVNAMDTTGAERAYARPDGKQVVVKGGDYGWITDSEATAEAVREALVNAEGGPIEITMKQRAAQAPDQYGRDFGARYIDVDLTEQYARFYDGDGSILWESDIVSGKPADGRATPEGTYYIKTNDGKSVLRGYKPDGTKDYETEVAYWMPFKDNSIGFHDAGWQAQFGGDWYLEHGSHGCINLPPEKAEELHGLLSVGDVVVVHS
ncbi:L,D-transpeptidase family protein [Adlercreutzia muris]|uniref:L,D-transpeptidase family protein n=1 Tax=Adlercreutzia muris TaxID=1796610 RepID=UPI0035128FC0